MVVVPAVLLELEMEDVLSWLLVMISTDVAPVEELEMRLSTRSSVVDVASIMELVGIVSASVVELGIVSASVVELESMLVDSSMEVVIATEVSTVVEASEEVAAVSIELDIMLVESSVVVLVNVCVKK